MNLTIAEQKELERLRKANSEYQYIDRPTIQDITEILGVRRRIADILAKQSKVEVKPFSRAAHDAVKRRINRVEHGVSQVMEHFGNVKNKEVSKRQRVPS